MNNNKIIQIIPAPENLYAIYKDDDNPDIPMEVKVICLGLTNEGKVILLDVDDTGYIEEVSEASNFQSIEWK